MILVIARQIMIPGKIRILRQTTNDNINDDSNNNHHHRHEDNNTDFNRQA